MQNLGNMKDRMKLCIAGKNNIAVDILTHALSFFSKDDICVLLNKTENFKNTWQKSLGFYAKQLEIPILRLNDVCEIENLIFISLEYDEIIKPSSFKTTKLYNIHFSYLPAYKGLFTSCLPILHGQKYSGVTLHEIDNGIDTGDIIEQKKIHIEGCTSSDLYFKYIEEGTRLIKNNFEKLIHNTYKTKKQSLLGSTYYSRRSFDFTLTEVEVRQTSFQIYSFVNCLHFRPYQLATFKGFKICKAEIIACNINERVGSIKDENQKWFDVQSMDSCIRLYKDYYDLLMKAIEAKAFEQIGYFAKLVSDCSDINEFNQFGWNPVLLACYSGSYESVKIVLDFGGDVHSKNLDGETTLMYATTAYEAKKDFKLIHYLIDNGVNVKSKDVFGKTVFDYTNDTQVIDLFKRHD